SHLEQLLPAPVMLAAAGWGSLRRRARGGAWRPRVALAALSLWGLGALGWGVQTTWRPEWARLRDGVPLQGAAIRAAIGPGVAAAVAAIQARTSPGEPIFDVPYLPMLYTLAQRPNATRHDMLFPGQVMPGVEAEIIAALEARNVRLVVVHDFAWNGL